MHKLMDWIGSRKMDQLWSTTSKRPSAQSPPRWHLPPSQEATLQCIMNGVEVRQDWGGRNVRSIRCLMGGGGDWQGIGGVNPRKGNVLPSSKQCFHFQDETNSSDLTRILRTNSGTFPGECLASKYTLWETNLTYSHKLHLLLKFSQRYYPMEFLTRSA